MVKGITRQVILVKSPDPRLFEEAIFIVKEEALAREGVSADKVLREARQAANGYLKQGRAWNRRLERIPAPFWSLLGAAGQGREDLAVYLGRAGDCTGGLGILVESLSEAGYRMCPYRA